VCLDKALLGSHLWSRAWRRDRKKKKGGGEGLEPMGMGIGRKREGD